jgi:hypothetical protein
MEFAWRSYGDTRKQLAGRSLMGFMLAVPRASVG